MMPPAPSPKRNLPAVIDPERLKATRVRVHPRCIVCSPTNLLGLRQDYAVLPDGSVESTLVGSGALEGYSGLLHGGVTAALLDGAMTNCLFAHGVQAVTAELTVRYLHPVAVRGTITTRGWLLESHTRLHLLRGELRQDGRVKATALAKFIEP